MNNFLLLLAPPRPSGSVRGKRHLVTFIGLTPIWVMMRDLLNVLPDDRPVTSLCIIEDPVKRPQGYHVVYRTYDQDIDADLWKEGFFGKKITRYLCLSKSEGRANFVVDSMTVINDKDLPPDGFTALTHTADTEQKATKKRLICYRTIPREKATQAITDIIVLSKSKKAPTGFTLAGDMNGFIICFKSNSVTKGFQQSSSNPLPTNNGPSSGRYTNSTHYSNSPRHAEVANSLPPTLPYPVTPLSSSGRPPPPLPPPPNSNPNPSISAALPLYPVEQLQSVTPIQPPVRNYTLPKNMGLTRTWSHSRHYAAASNHYAPSRCAPSPLPHAVTNYANSKGQNGTSGVVSGLEGILFQVNPKFKEMQHLKNVVIPNLDHKSMEQIESEFNYDFSIERLALQRIPSNGQ